MRSTPDRYAASYKDSRLIPRVAPSRIAVLGARSAPKETREQPRALPGYRGRSPWLFTRAGAAAVALAALMSSGCGEFVRESRSPSQLVIQSIGVASITQTGVTPTFGSGPLLSDVLTRGSIFNDLGQVTMRLILRDQGASGVTATPTPLNDVTVTRYRVVYRRADGRNTHACQSPRPREDEIAVPCPFDGAVTFTVSGGGTILAAFELVRHVAKIEAPLAALITNFNILTTIADVTFFGHDQAGNAISVTGQVQVNFADFADPPSGSGSGS